MSKLTSFTNNIQRKIMSILKFKKFNITKQHLLKFAGLAAISAMVLIPEFALAADAAIPDAFGTMHTKVNGWLTGSLGKLITLLSFVVTAFMGVAGYPVKAILGVAMLGLTLSSADSLISMLF